MQEWVEPMLDIEGEDGVSSEVGCPLPMPAGSGEVESIDEMLVSLEVAMNVLHQQRDKEADESKVPVVVSSSLPMPVAESKLALSSLPMPAASAANSHNVTLSCSLKAVLEYEWRVRRQLGENETAMAYVDVMNEIGTALCMSPQSIIDHTIKGMKWRDRLQPLHLRSLDELRMTVNILTNDEAIRKANGRCYGCQQPLKSEVHCFKCHAAGHRQYECPMSVEVEKKSAAYYLEGQLLFACFAKPLPCPLISAKLVAKKKKKKKTPTKVTVVMMGGKMYDALVVKDLPYDLLMPIA